MSETIRIDELLEQVDQTPFGPEERALIDQAIAIAIDSGDEFSEYRARMRLASSANMTGDTDALLSSFAWCLGKHDADAARFPAKPDDSASDLLWQYKWMAGTLSASPAFPAADIRGVLDDMQSRYERAGVGQSGVAMARFGAAFANGWLDEAAEAYRVLTTTERDDYSHCDACVRSESAAYLAATGREDEAISLYEEIVEGGFSCGEEPEHALSDALLPYLRAGRLDRAKSFHLRSYRDARGNADNIGIIANHLVFCAITGNEARGLAMLERHIAWIAHDRLNQRAQFSALAATGLLLDTVVDAGHGDTVVRGADSAELEPFFGAHTGPWTAAELSPAAWAAAAAIGDEFDRRNGNSHLADRLQATRALRAERYDVAITGEAFAIPVPVVAAEPVDAGGWVDRARELAALGDIDRALAAADRGLAVLEADAAASVADDRRAELIGIRLAVLVAASRLEEAEQELPARIAALRAAGDELLADALARHGLLLAGSATASDLPVLEQELGAALQSGADDLSARVALRITAVRAEAGDLEGAGTAADTAIAVLDRAPEPEPMLVGAAFQLAAYLAAQGEEPATALPLLDRAIAAEPTRVRRAESHRLRARLLAGSGDLEAALAASEAALEHDLAIDARMRVVEDCQLSAAILDDLARPDDAVARLRLAVQHAELAESPGLVGVRYGLGRQLLRAGRTGEAVELLQDVFEAEVAAGAPPAARAETLHLLGTALRGEEEFAAASGAWHTAAELFEEAEAWPSAVAVLADLGRLFAGLGYAEEAIEVLERAVADARRDPETVASLADALHLLGQVSLEHGEPNGLDQLDEVAALAREHGADWLLADVVDSRARGLAALSRPEEAVATALTAAELFEAVGATRPAGGSMLFAGRVLQSEVRHDEALVLIGQAIERFDGQADAVALGRIALADSLEALGRLAEAAEARRLAEEV
ncbi:tetratricopeptide (TPR) repeat protein [Agromyces hippuratus]|uniref:Tetratricopeptide (TPR) repeat protein n=1 Tax=Agromyces hippuratus TaxID=286438 RepID=A0A852WZU7_9MICO|nr:hypothetical protein [Agromyces hippuratus]NYG21453.1 tetratricopeptide (TPR) repeat protein [Agromyces hippuratus]